MQKNGKQLLPQNFDYENENSIDENLSKTTKDQKNKSNKPVRRAIIISLAVLGFSLLAFFFVVTILSPSGVETWQRKFGGINDDVVNSIQQTTDGGYIVAGRTDSFGSGKLDVYVLKLNSKGDLKWEKTFGGVEDDVANFIQQTTDGGYIVAGHTDSFGSGKLDVYVLKLNSKGDLEWEKTFGSIRNDEAYSIQQARDGGYIVAGYTVSLDSRGNAYILKLNSQGDLEWEKTFGGKYWDEANSIQQNADGGYIVTGYTESLGLRGDIYILKLNLEGNLEWEKTFGGVRADEAYSIQQTRDGGYIVAGYTYSFGPGIEDLYVVKLDSEVGLEWQKTFGDKNEEKAYSIQQTRDGGYIVAGYTKSFGLGESDIYILKLYPHGEIEWQKTFGGKNEEKAYSVQQTKDGGYIVAGNSGDDVYVLKLNSDGEVENE
mgnify:CR=1 FL=1